MESKGNLNDISNVDNKSILVGNNWDPLMIFCFNLKASNFILKQQSDEIHILMFSKSNIFNLTCIWISECRH